MSQFEKNNGSINIMLISDRLSSNIIICIWFFDLTHFRELGHEYRNILVWFLVQMKTLKFASEIN